MFIMAFRALVLSMLLGLGQASLDPRALGGQQSTSSSTTPTPSPTSQTSAPSSTSASAPATSSTAGSQGGGGGPTSSPLLFFVALGFGVVFTNLWYASNPLLNPFHFYSHQINASLILGSSLASSTAFAIISDIDRADPMRSANPLTWPPCGGLADDDGRRNSCQWRKSMNDFH